MKVNILIHYGKYGQWQLFKNGMFTSFGYIAKIRHYPQFALYIYWTK